MNILRTTTAGIDLAVLDEFTRECLTIEAARSFTAHDVILTL